MAELHELDPLAQEAVLIVRKAHEQGHCCIVTTRIGDKNVVDACGDTLGLANMLANALDHLSKRLAPEAKESFFGLLGAVCEELRHG